MRRVGNARTVPNSKAAGNVPNFVGMVSQRVKIVVEAVTQRRELNDLVAR